SSSGNGDGQETESDPPAAQETGSDPPAAQEKASDPPGSTQATDSKAQAVQEEDDPPEAQVGDRRAFAARGSQEDASAALGATAMVQAEVQADPVAEPAKEPEDDEYDCEEFEPDFSEEEDDRELTQRSDAATSPRGTASKSETSELQANLERPSAENSSETNKVPPVVGLPLSQKAEEADQTDSRRSMAMSFKESTSGHTVAASFATPSASAKSAPPSMPVSVRDSTAPSSAR
ncbi:unnamed protein product, partial [Symbiodinium microadriaticum]